MTDLSQYSDQQLLGMLSQQSPSAVEDSLASFAGGVERGVAGTAMILPDILNQAVAGPQMLYRGLTGREHDNSAMWQPFYSSEDVLQKLPSELRPHDAQTIAGKIAGFMGGLTGGVGAMYGGKVLNDTALPFYQGGRNKIMADLMQSKANDPAQAALNISKAPEYVAGSTPIAGVASGDIGLMGLQRGIENLPTSEQLFKDRAIQQTAAQNQELGNVSGNAADMPALIKARADASAPLYEQAKQQVIDQNAIKPVLDELDKKIALAGPQNDSGKLLISLKNKIEAGLPNSQPAQTGILDAEGNMITRPADPTLQQPVIGTYRETRDALNLKGMQPGALGSEVRGNIQPANIMLGKALEAQSPSFSQAQELYRQGSVPIDQLEAGQAIKSQVQSNSPNARGQLPISQPKLQQLMENGVVNVDGKEISISQLTAAQRQSLSNLQNDLNRNMSSVGSRVKPTSALELNNLSIQSPITGLASHIPIIKGITNAKNLQIQQQLAKVMMDNPEAERLLMSGQPRNPQALMAILMQSGLAGTGGVQ